MIHKNGIYTKATKVVDGGEIDMIPSKKINKAMALADTVSKSVADKEIVITSIFDGTHGNKSLHYTGNAFDIRIWIYTPNQTRQIITELSELLGNDYDVVLEGDHIHMEYQPKIKQNG